jgi:hypothetical protein
MNRNFRFIFPRLIGATVIVGVASLIFITLFKLMAGLLVIGGAAALIKRFSRSEDRMTEAYSQFAEAGIHPLHNPYDRHNRVYAVAAPQRETIVPIN